MEKAADSNVKVAVRIRPQLARERIEMCRVCTSVMPGEPQVLIGQDKSFTFDYVFDLDSTQEQIYNSCGSKLIEGTYDGFNATILAYGQTGSGKTYTMGTAFDLHVDSDDQIGIVPRALEHLFTGINERRQAAIDNGESPPEFKVNAQFMELYNEEVFDLLDVTRDPADKNRKSHIKIHEDARGEIYTVGLTTRPVNSLQETLQCLKVGTLSRTTASTNMNAQSSRSHAIFTLLVKHQRVRTVEVEGDGPPQSEVEMLSAKFNFVDLAGSERLKRTGATGDRAREGISINCGLLALGNVISALGDEEKRGCHVPYRDSKLTRLLQDSLGGNSNTVMIACISPSDCDFLETLNTLKYANRARNICNKVVANQDTASRQLGAMRAEIQALQQELMDYRMGRRIPDAEFASDTQEENVMLRTENGGLRQRVRALQETIETLTTRNVQLQTERDRLTLTSTLATGDGNSNDEIQQLIEGYVKETEHLKASLTESQSLVESLQQSANKPRCAPFNASSRMSSSYVSNISGIDVSFDPDDHVEQLLHEAKLNIIQLKKLEESAHVSTKHKDDSKENDDEEHVEGSDAEGSEQSDSEQDDECQMLNEKLADIVGEISIKQKLIDELESSQKRLHALRAHYEEKLSTLASRIRETELERDKVLANLASSTDGGKDASAKKVREEYSAKLNSMQNEVKKLQAAKREHTKLLRNQTHYETQLRTLQGDLNSLKQMKVKLMRQLQEEAQKSRQSEQKSQKAIAQLQKQQRVKDNQIKSLETDKKQKELVLKRKLEEVSALRRQQKSAMSAKAAGRTGRYSRNATAETSSSVTRQPSGRSGSGTVQLYDPRLFRTSWDNLEKLITTIVTRRQTLVHLDRDMERWIKQREVVGRKLERLLKKHEKALSADVEVVNLSDLTEQIDTLRDNMTYIQDNINECQNSIVHVEEFKDDDMDADSIFVSSSLAEAMYLLEHCTNLAINNGLSAALKGDECREMEAKLHQEQMESIFQRDMLQYLIQDKVDVAVDNGVIWQDEDESDDSSSCSLSPVDSLENQLVCFPASDVSVIVDGANAGSLSDSSKQPLVEPVEPMKSTETESKVPESSSEPVKPVEKQSPIKSLPVNGRDKSLPRKSPNRLESSPSKSGRIPSSPSPARRNPQPPATKPGTLETAAPRNRERKLRSDASPSRDELARSVLARGVINAAAAATQAPLPGSCPLVHCRTAVGHTKAVLSVFVSDNLLYTASKDRTAKIWDLSSGIEIQSFSNHPTSVIAVKYSPASKLVFTASAYLVKVWDPRAAGCVYTLTSAGMTSDGSLSIDDDPSRPVSCPPGEINIADIALGTSSSTLYTAAGNTVRTWDLRSLRSVGKLYGANQAGVTALAVGECTTANSSAFVVTGSKDRCLKVFQVSADCSGVVSPRCSLEPSHSDGIQSLCMMGNVLYSGARDMGIMKWDVTDTPQLKYSIANAHRDWICGLACLQPSSGSCNGGSLLLSACRAGVLKVWNASNCSLLGEVQAHIGAINCVAVDQPTGLGFTGSADRTVRIWKAFSAS